MERHPIRDEEHKLTGLVRRLMSHVPLDAREQKAILALPVRIVERERNSYLVREGDMVAHSAILLTGLVERHRIGSDGKRQILSIYVPGDPVDLDHLFLPLADDALQTLKRSMVALVDHRDLRRVMELYPAVARALIVAMLVDASIYREWTINVGRREARARIVHLLCELAFRLELQGVHGPDLSLPLTQYQIADATGLTAVHVNRTLKGLQAEGLIHAAGGTIGSRDWQALWDMADFSPSYLHPLAGESP